MKLPSENRRPFRRGAGLIVIAALLTITQPNAVAQNVASETAKTYLGCKRALAIAEDRLVDANEDDAMAAGECLGQLGALFDFNILMHKIDGRLMFCPITVPSLLQTQKIVVAFIDSHPRELARSFSELGLLALREAYPCPNLWKELSDALGYLPQQLPPAPVDPKRRPF